MSDVTVDKAELTRDMELECFVYVTFRNPLNAHEIGSVAPNL
jgi:hypothetical protein